MRIFIDILLVILFVLILAFLANALTYHYYGYQLIPYYTTVRTVPASGYYNGTIIYPGQRVYYYQP